VLKRNSKDISKGRRKNVEKIPEEEKGNPDPNELEEENKNKLDTGSNKRKPNLRSKK